jgi:hypothetical protein
MNAMKATKMSRKFKGTTPLNRYWPFALILLMSLSLISIHSFLSTSKTNDESTSPTNHDTATRQRINEAFGKLPLYFVENRGQVDERVAYSIQGKDKSIWFTSEGLTCSITGREADNQRAIPEGRLQPVALNLAGEAADRLEKWTLKLDFVGANPGVRLVGQQPTPATFSYFKGKRQDWKSGLKTYSSIVYENLWDGIDLVYSGTVNRMKYTFVVRPGADPAQIKFAYRGASEIKVNQQGELEVNTPAGGFKDDSPVSFQEIGGQQVEVATRFKLGQLSAHPSSPGTPSEYGFEMGDYDKTRELIIDPAVLIYCGYIGGDDTDEGEGIAVDSAGNAYVTGNTKSNEDTFPVSVGPDTSFNGVGPSSTQIGDCFVAKINAQGTALVYCGYIGGSQRDTCNAVAVDGNDRAYVTGETDSDQTTFPVNRGPGYHGNTDAFIAKPSASGATLDICVYLGGIGFDRCLGIAVSAAGNVYVAGFTNSIDFLTFGGMDDSINGNGDGFITKYDSSLTFITYSSFLGGGDVEGISGIAVDRFGNAYVTGGTASDELPKGERFPVVTGPDTTYNGGRDVFVAKISECEITCPADITRDNDLNQCGAVVNFSTPPSTCGQVTCSPVSGTFFPVGTTPVRCTDEANTRCTFTVTVRDAQKPALACPANLTKSNDPGLCSAVVTYNPPTVTDNCPNVGAPSCNPPSGSTFPVGATSVNCTAIDASNNVGVCSFTITVVDREPPKISCPANITAVAPVACPRISTAVVNYPAPVVTDNCPGVTYTCSPSSGSVFPAGVTKVTCTATDTGGNTAACSFNVTVFDVRAQNDANPGTVLLFNSLTGDYRFCCNGITYTGKGKATRLGCIYTLEHSTTDRRVLGKIDKAIIKGTASLQSPPGNFRCTFSDRDTRNNSCSCQ